MGPRAGKLRVDASPLAGYRERACRGALRFERAWRDVPTWRGPPAVVPWLGIAVAVAAVAVRASGLEPRSSVALVTVLTAWFTLTLLFAWEALLRALNRTRITFDDDALCVSHGPLPCASSRELLIARQEIERFHALAGHSDHGRPMWTLAVETRDGARTAILDLSERRDAFALRAALTAHLGR